jgi:hypothetical protein
LLRIDLLDPNILRISGRLVEGSSEEVRLFVDRHKTSSNLVVDLSEVTFVDSKGEEALLWLKHHAASFRSDCAYALDVCERLRLSIAKRRTPTRGSDLGGVRG